MGLVVVAVKPLERLEVECTFSHCVLGHHRFGICQGTVLVPWSHYGLIVDIVAESIDCCFLAGSGFCSWRYGCCDVEQRSQ